MGTDGKSFGEYLAYLREMKNVTLRELARQIGDSAPFLSDVEKGRRAALTAERLDLVVKVLNLNEEEKHNLYTAAGTQKKTIPLDLPEYIMEHEYVSAALRTARDLEAGEEEWQKFIEDLKRRRG